MLRKREVDAALLELVGREHVKSLLASINSEVIPAVATVTSAMHFLTPMLLTIMVKLRSPCVNHSFSSFTA